jgi:2-polyprenyl-3-methyl-5-hydroxy-6-metoxy-1,4-benzoquinol methylase
MESISCMLCSTRTATTPMVKQRDINVGCDDREFVLVRCNDCGLIYLSPRPSPGEIQFYYPKEYYPLEQSRIRKPIDRFFKRISGALKKGIREEFYGYPRSRSSGPIRRILRRLLLYPEYWHLKLAGREIIPFRGAGRILDVGCGPGKLLRVLRDDGWDAYGVDFSQIAVDHARRVHGLNVKLGDLREAAYDEAFFDVVIFNHVLEHVYNPVETLQEVHRILKPGGLLVINIPNAGSFEARVFGRWWVQWDVPRHLYHFTKKTMQSLLSTTRFRLIEVKQGSGTSFFLGSVDAVYKHVFRSRRKHGLIMRRFIAKPVCQTVALLGFGSEMKVYAEKVTSA